MTIPTTVRRLLAPLALALLCTACAGAGRGSSHGVFRDPSMDFGLIQTVAVMPFANLTAQPRADERVRDVFTTMLQATGSLYVLPPGEVSRGIARSKIENPQAPSAEDVLAFAQIVKADVVITGTVREYGEMRSGSSSANVISVSAKMIETQTGKVVWSASSTEGGVSTGDRLFGGGGRPMDEVTEQAVKDLLKKLFE